MILLVWCVGCSRCALCARVDDEFVSIDSTQVTLALPTPPEPELPDLPQEDPPPPVIAKRPTPTPAPVESEVAPEDIISSLSSAGPLPMPPGAILSDDLTMRLRERMAESFGGAMDKVPDAKIYLGNGSLEEFIAFYEGRGYKVQRVAVPVKRILQPVLRDRPELENRIHLENYEGQVIHQVMVEGTGVSAADRYIDPDSFEVVDRLFVTEMPLR